MTGEGLSFNSSEASNVENELTIDNILKRVPEIVIWRYYVGSSFRVEKPFNAPYRNDINASFSLKYDARERLMFKDFGRPGMYGDIFNYLQAVNHISFIEALEKVNEDFDLNLVNKTNKIVVKKTGEGYRSKIGEEEIEKLLRTEQKLKESSKSTVRYEARIRRWNELDLIYWNNYGISEQTLKRYFVYPAECIKKNGYIDYEYIESNPCYVYYFPKSKHIKCYMPYSPNKSKRFFGNVNNLEDIQGYYQCDIKGGNREDKLLILTKSMKDVMLLRELGFDAVALHGENHRFNDDFIRHITKYYSKIVSLYDRDRAGILGARRLWKDHRIKPFFIQKKWHCKDISDLFMTYGNEIVQDFLVSLKNRIN